MTIAVTTLGLLAMGLASCHAAKNEEAMTPKIVFVGDSITYSGDWNALLKRTDIVNQGISGDRTLEILARMDDILAVPARRYFLMIGINDLGHGMSVDAIAANTGQIIQLLRQAHPDADIFLQSVLPVNEIKSDWGISNETINQLNGKLQVIADGADYITYVDVQSALSDASGNLDAGYTEDGVHLTHAGYVDWAAAISPLFR